MASTTTSSSTYGMRFEFLVSTYFDVDSQVLAFDLAGHPAVLKAVHERPLRDTGQVAIVARGFSDESEAAEFGYRLQRATTLAATKTDLGIDVGRNRIRTSISEEMRQAHFEKTGRIVRNRVHGVDVFRENPPTHVIVMEGFGTVRINPQIFLKELDASFTAWPEPISADLEKALHLRGRANQASDNLVRMLLAVAAVEALTPDESWTDKQKELLQSFADSARNFSGITEREIEEVVVHLTSRWKLTISEGFRRLLVRLGLQDLWPRWRAIYHARSRILHGDAPPEEVLATIDETMRLSRTIVLKAAALEIAGADIMVSDAPAGEVS